MDKFYRFMTDSTWWISVVVMGVILNIISSYLRDITDWILKSCGKGALNYAKRDIQKTINQSYLAENDQIILVIVSSSIVPLQQQGFLFSLLGSVLIGFGIVTIESNWLGLLPVICGIVLFLVGTSRIALAQKRYLMLDYLLDRRIQNIKNQIKPEQGPAKPPLPSASEVD